MRKDNILQKLHHGEYIENKFINKETMVPIVNITFVRPRPVGLLPSCLVGADSSSASHAGQNKILTMTLLMVLPKAS